MNRKEKQFSLEKKHAFWHQKINEGEREIALDGSKAFSYFSLSWCILIFGIRLKINQIKIKYKQFKQKIPILIVYNKNE
jgi:hypothetical protein